MKTTMNYERGTMIKKGSPLGRTSSLILHHSSFPHSAFTLTEMLIVIGLIVLLLAMSLPMINLITGARSTEAAQNQIAAMLARGRAQAIADQKPAGVFFFISPDNDRVSMALVQQFWDATNSSNRPSSNNDPDVTSAEVYLDLVADSDVVTLPKGVGAETIDDAALDTSKTPNQRYDDGYFGYNNYNVAPTPNHVYAGTRPPTYILYGPVILFDGSGRITHQRYGFKTFTRASGSPAWTDMGQLMFHKDRNVDVVPVPQMPSSGTDFDVVPWMIYNTSMASPPAPSAPSSSIGLVLFDREKFKTQFSAANAPADLDWQLGTGAAVNATGYKAGTTTDEYSKELWLDQNAAPLMINRYNGTLLKTE